MMGAICLAIGIATIELHFIRKAVEEIADHLRKGECSE